MAKSELERNLEELDALRKEGVLSDSEYEVARQRAIETSEIGQRPQPEAASPAAPPRSSRFGCGKLLLIIVGVLVVIGIIAAVTTSGGDDSGSTPSSTNSRASGTSNGSTTSSRPTPTAVKTVREKIEDCLSPLDGNHNGFEDQIRPLLNDEGSMRTHSTRFGTTPLANRPQEVGIVMEYSANNAFGARIKKEAVGRLNFETCRVTVVATGLE